MEHKPVEEFKITKAQLNCAVQTYLNEHVFKEPIAVESVKADQYNNVTVTLGAETNVESDGPSS